MSAPDTWTFAVILVAVTVGALLAAGLIFALIDWRAVRREGKGARNA